MKQRAALEKGLYFLQLSRLNEKITELQADLGIRQ